MTDLFEVLEHTWPAAKTWDAAGWRLRDGAGGGKRVSAASRIDAAANVHDAIGHMERPLFMVRDGEDDLDQQLAAAGLSVLDPTLIYRCPIDNLIDGPLPLAKTYAVWAPLHCMKEVWSAGGIGPHRLNVMHRTTGPKSGILGRAGDAPVGAGFVAIHKGVAMIHALEVLDSARQQGVARRMMAQAAHWAQANGATQMALAVTQGNLAANPLYVSLGMEVVTRYHYRG